MNISVREMLQDKGIEISDNILLEVETRWNSVNKMKESLEKSPVSTTSIALRNLPGRDKI